MLLNTYIVQHYCTPETSLVHLGHSNPIMELLKNVCSKVACQYLLAVMIFKWIQQNLTLSDKLQTVTKNISSVLILCALALRSFFFVVFALLYRLSF